MKLSRLLGATALAGSLLLVPTVAFAQDEPAQSDASASDVSSDDTITVTGSRIRRPNLESSVPVTTVSGEELFQQGQSNLGDTLNDLPQLRSTFAQQNPGAGVGITGLNLLDLRGLGTVRSLILVNGRRHVPADILNNASSPDVNTISNDLIERVEIVTGGSSAVYGSDAIAGVVNFILRKDFDGLQVRGNAAISQEGYGGNQFGSVMWGKNFADGRGNITLQAEYAHQERVYASDIKAFRQNDGFVTVDTDVGGLPQGSDGFPDAVFFRDIRSATIHRFGMVVVPQPQGAGACGVGTLANNGGPNNLGTSYHCNFVFGADGTLAAQTGTRVGSGPAGTFIGGNGQTSREGTQLSILPSGQRINLNALARFEVSPALEFFFEGKYVRTNSVGNQLGPTFLNGSTGSLGADPLQRIDMRLDNPFLSAAARTTIANAYTAANCGYTFGLAVSAATCVTGTPAQQAARAAAIANGSFRFLFARNLTDSEDRDEHFRRETYRFVGGIRGQFNDDWNYELSANYGKFQERADMHGFVDRQRFLLSLDAGRNPVTNAIQCRSQFDAASAVGASLLAGSAAAASKLTSDIAACVPYNPFGSTDNSAAVNYFKANIVNHASISQLDINGFVSGDLSQLFELPGGPIGFVIGGEYRREKAFNDSDDAADTGLSNSVFLGDVAASFNVKEVFGEVNIPFFKDVPYLGSLTVSGAGRISDYNTGAGTTYSYNAGFEWAPIPDIRFRGNYGRAVRAPNVSEALFPSVKNFANAFIDPCNANAIANGTAARVTNCQSQLTPAQLANLPLAGYSLGIISGSNADLKAEKSDSYTVGAVIQPRFIPGLALTVDYYKITVKGAIVSLAAQTIVNSCYDTPGLASPLCNAFERNLSGSNGTFGETPGQILFYTLVSGPQNFAKRVRSGIDLELTYRGEITSDLKFNTRLNYTHLLKDSNFENPTIPETENVILRELGDPKDEFRFDANLIYDRFTFGYGMHYIGPMLTTTFENLFPNNQGVPGQTGLPLNSDAFEITKYPATFYHDVRLDMRIGDRSEHGRELNFFLGVDNILNTQPPLGSTATGAGSAIYSIRGRTFYTGFKANF